MANILDFTTEITNYLTGELRVHGVEDPTGTPIEGYVDLIKLVATGDPDAIHDNVAAEILAITEKTNPTTADLILIEDVADLNNKKRIEIGNLPGVSGSLSSVGTGGEYATVKAAFDAGKYSLSFIDDVIETAICSPPSLQFVRIELNGYNWDLSTFLVGSTGIWDIRNGEITMAPSSGTTVFDVDGLTAYSVIFDNNSTSASAYIADIGTFYDCTLELPNLSKCGLYLENHQVKTVNLRITGGGTSCDYGLYNTGSAATHSFHNNIQVDGTWITSATIIDCDSKGIITGCRVSLTCATTVLLICYEISNLKDTGNDVKLKCYYGNNIETYEFDDTNAIAFSNMKVLNVSGVAFASSDVLYSNCSLYFASFAADRTKFSNCEFLNGVTIISTADYNQFSNCEFDGDMDFEGDYNSLSNCNFPSHTISTAISANFSSIVGCLTDTAITDGGTNTIAFANRVI